MEAWHFTNKNMTLGYDDGRKIVEGETLSCEGNIVLCRNGMHGSKRIIDAVHYAPGPILTRVEITGDVVEGNDKLAGRHRKVLWSLDATEILHRFAVQIALDACQKAGVTDPVVLAAPQAKIDWLEGKISKEELVATKSAASSVARSMECSARSMECSARSAAWSDVEWSAFLQRRSEWLAAWSAAESAAWSAAESAAWSAAWLMRSCSASMLQLWSAWSVVELAAGSAASAAGSAAESAAKAAQEKLLQKLVSETERY